MRASVASLSKKFITTFFAATLALGLVPTAAFAVEGDSAEDGTTSLPVVDIINEEVALDTVVAQTEATTSYFLAQTLETTRTIPMVSASLPLGEVVEGDEQEGEGLPVASTVIGSFEYRGIVYAVEPGGESVAAVAADQAKLPEEFIEAQAIVLPSIATSDDIDHYSVTRIADHAFANLKTEGEGIIAVGIPASVASIDDEAFTGFETLQYIIVSEDNPAYSSYDGALYNADQTCLLLIPEGRLGAVRVASSVTEVAPEAFSHCPSVDTLITDPDSAAYQLLREGEYTNSSDKRMEITIRDDAFKDDSGTSSALSFGRASVYAAKASSALSGSTLVSLPDGFYLEGEMYLSASGAAVYKTNVNSVRLYWDRRGENMDQAMVFSNQYVFSCLSSRIEGNKLLYVYSSKEGSSYPMSGTWYYDAAYTDPITHGAYGGQTICVSNQVPLTAYWKPNSFTIDWDMKGHGSVPVDAKTSYDYFDADYVLPVPNNISNWVFRGWYDNEACTGTAVTKLPAKSIGNKTFWASWEAKPIITVTWNSNGGSAVNNTTATYSDTAKVPMPSSNPTKAGYTFANWWTDPSGGTQVTSSTNLPSSDPIYYAHWTANTISCTWNSSGGSAVGNTTATYGTSATVPMPGSNPTKTGYAFAGWWTAAEGGVQVTASTTLPTSNPTYYAHWTENGYTITWNMKGVGSQPSGAKTTYKYEDADYTLPTPTAVAGYTFGGWYENEACTGAAVTKLLNHSTGNKTYWAKWTGNTITITWNSEGGSAVGSTSATYSSAAKVPMPGKTTYPGRTFAGWYTHATGGTLVTEDSLLPTSNAEYHAHWTTDEYTITWKMKDHGSVPSGAKGTYGYDDADYTLPEPAHVPGWTFQGWYDNEACTGSAVSVLSTHSEGDKTFWAKWSQDDYTVTFDLTPQDGRPQAVQPSSLPVLTWHYGEDLSKVTFPTSNRDGGFYRNGYTFDGWAYKQGDTFVKVYDAASGKGVGTYQHESGTTLYAQWTPITCTVNFHWNYVGGGTYTYEVKYDDELSFTKGESERESNKDYELTGWFTEDETQELAFVDGKARFAPVFSTTAPRVIDYYAKWKAPEPITITLHTGAHATFSDGAKERTGTLEYSKSVNLRDPERGLDPKPDTGYDFIGWRRAVLDENGEPVKDGNGDYVVEDGSYVTTVGPYETKDLHLIAHISANACSVTLLPGTEDGKSVPRNEVTYQGWNHPGDVYEFDISHFTGENGQVSSLVLPNATRAGYAFSGWRLANSQDKPAIGLVIDPKEIATSTTRNRIFEAVWTPKDFTVLFVPNRGDLAQDQAKQEEQKTTVSLKGSVTMPYPATRAEGDVSVANGKASSIFSGWTLAATPSLSDDIHAAKTSVPVRDIASYADDDDAITFYAQWNRAISVTCPLYATIAIDPENEDIVASENMALTSYYGSSTSTPELEVVSVRYDKLKGEQTSIFDATLATSGVFDKGKVYLTVYAGCDKPDLRHDAEYVAPSLRIDLGSSLVIPKDSTDASVQTLKGATGFDKRFSSTGDSLSLYYGLEFGQGVDPRSFVDTLPENDAGGANGWSSQSYPIARIYYTVGLAQ